MIWQGDSLVMVLVCKNPVALNNRNVLSYHKVSFHPGSHLIFTTSLGGGQGNSHQIVQMGKLRLKETKKLIQSHTHTGRKEQRTKDLFPINAR